MRGKCQRWAAALIIAIPMLLAVACGLAATPTPYAKPIHVPTSVPGATPSPALKTPGEPATGGQPGAERMIVRTGNVVLVVLDVASTIQRIAELAETFSGYVVSSKMWEQGQRTIGTITIRIAAQYYDDAVRALRQMAAQVTSETSSAQDVTEEYVDLKSRLRNLEVTEQQLLKLMGQAKTVDEALNVQRELTNIQGQIEQTKGRMQYLETSSATSLLEVHLEQAKLDVEFTATRARLYEGEEIQFAPRIAGGFAPYSYEWAFGDGTSSTEESPVHVYEAAGRYTVSLAVTDDKGNKAAETRDDYITVTTRPGWSAGKTLRDAWRGLVLFGRALGNIAIWLSIFAVLWVPVGVVMFLWLRQRRKGS